MTLSYLMLDILMTIRRIITPLWTARTDLDSFDVDPKSCLPVDDLAKTMGNLVQQGKFTGGTVYLRSLEDDKIAFEGIEGDEKATEKELPQTKKVQKLLQSERRAKL